MRKGEQQKIKERVPCNLIQCDMYAFNPTICGFANPSSAPKSYYELQVVEDSNGYHEELVEVDYPITPEYVASFEASANFKNDVDGAIANGQKRANLGDITAYQEALNMDTALIADLANRLKVANEQLAKQNSSSQTANTAQVQNSVNNVQGGADNAK